MFHSQHTISDLKNLAKKYTFISFIKQTSTVGVWVTSLGIFPFLSLN